MSSDCECPQDRLAKELLPDVQALIASSVKIADTQTLTTSAIFTAFDGDQPLARIIVPATASLKLKGGQPLDFGDINCFPIDQG